MAVTKKAKIQIAADTRKAENSLKRLGVSTAEADKKLATLEKSLKSISASGVVTGLSSAVDLFGKLTSSIKGSTQQAFQFSAVSRAFTGDLEKARRAAGGLATDFELMQSKVKLTTLGVKVSDDQFAKLIASTRKLAPLMGRTMKDALDDLSTALARGSKMVADNLGIIVSQETANKKYAKAIGVSTNALSDQQKKLALQNEMMEQLNDKAGRLSESTEDVASNIQSLSTELQNSKDRFVATINNSRALAAALRTVSEAAQGAIQFIEDMFNKSSTMKLRRRREEIRLALADPKQAQSPRDLALALHSSGRSQLQSELTGLNAQLSVFDRKASPFVTKPPKIDGFGIDEDPGGATGGTGRKRRGRRDLPTLAPDLQLLQGGAGVVPQSLATGSRRRGINTGTGESQQLGVAAIEARTKAMFEAMDAQKALNDQQAIYNEQIAEQARLEENRRQKIEMASGAFANLSVAMLESAISAAIHGENVGKAVAAATAAVLKGLATQAKVQALAELAKAFSALFTNPPAAAAHFKSAAIWGGVALAGGIASAGIGAAAGGGGRGAGAPAGRGGIGSERRTSSAPALPSRREKLPPMNFILKYDRADPAQQLIASQQLKAKLAAA